MEGSLGVRSGDRCEIQSVHGARLSLYGASTSLYMSAGTHRLVSRSCGSFSLRSVVVGEQKPHDEDDGAPNTGIRRKGPSRSDPPPGRLSSHRDVRTERCRKNVMIV